MVLISALNIVRYMGKMIFGSCVGVNRPHVKFNATIIYTWIGGRHRGDLWRRRGGLRDLYPNTRSGPTRRKVPPFKLGC